jgi:hypothetical protein
MKKRICAILLATAGTATVFGGDFSLSAGVGGILGGIFTRYTLSADGTVDGERIQVNAISEMDQFNNGYYIFLDATYGEFSVLYQNGANTYTETFEILGMESTPPASGYGRETVLGFSLLGKYPVSLNKRFIVFPLLGLEYQIVLRETRTQPDGWEYDRADGLREKDKDGNAYLLQDWNSLWVNLGGGADFYVLGNFSVRAELLYGFRLMTPYEVKNLEMMKSMAGDPNPKLGGLTSGPQLRLSAGYRFFDR